MTLNNQPGVIVTSSTTGKFASLFQTLNAYLAAFNEVAIVSITDLDGKIIYVNDRFVEISQYSQKELLGASHRIINSNHHPAEFFRNMWKTIAFGNPWRAEIKNKAKDGTFYWVDTVITPVKDRDGKPYQYLSIRNLITSQKENEERLVSYQNDLLKKKQQLKEAQTLAKTGSWFADISSKKIEWSEETYRIFEVPVMSPITYEIFLQYVHPDDREIVNATLKKAMQTGFYEVEHRIITQSGEKWVRERARFDFSSTVSLKTILGTVQDITDKKQAEQMIRETATQYIGLFNKSPFAIGILDKETLKFIKVNDTAVKLYGYTQEEFTQLTAYDIRIPEDWTLLTNQLQEGTYIGNKEVRKHRRKNGDIILVEPSVALIDYNGREAYLITINDITEKVEIEEQLEREKYRAQQEIDRAALEGEEKSRSEIGRELHDNINQLLAASVLRLRNTCRIADDESAKQIQEGIDIINTAVAEIRGLSSKIVSPSLNEFTLKEAIETLTANLRLSCKNVTSAIQLKEDELDNTFKINLYRIIQEQFSNIIKYAEATAIHVKLLQKNASLILEVTDNGKGFDQEKKAKGIGLANIRHRARLYEGKYNITSSPGKGCTLLIEFLL